MLLLVVILRIVMQKFYLFWFTLPAHFDIAAYKNKNARNKSDN